MAIDLHRSKEMAPHKYENYKNLLDMAVAELQQHLTTLGYQCSYVGQDRIKVNGRKREFKPRLKMAEAILTTLSMQGFICHQVEQDTGVYDIYCTGIK